MRVSFGGTVPWLVAGLMLFVCLPGKEFSSELATEYTPNSQCCSEPMRLWASYFIFGPSALFSVKHRAWKVIVRG